jgi:nucleotide-binding universal stress UspA family protein
MIDTLPEKEASRMNMYPVKRMLIALDNSSADASLIEAASFLAAASRTEEVFFVNVIKSSSIPASIQQEFPSLIENAIADRKARIEESVRIHFNKENEAQLHFEILKGNPSRQLLNKVSENNIDLVLVGRKPQNKNSNLTVHRLARRARCTIMLIPESGLDFSSQRLLVATDFSDHSVIALEKACDVMCQRAECVEPEVICQHVYTVPTGYHVSGKTFDEFAQVMLRNAKKEYEKFIQKVNTQGVRIKPVFTLNKSESGVKHIYDLARKEKVNGIVIGGRGQSSATAFFSLGSTAERIIDYDTELPLFIVRPKDLQKDFVEYLKEF